MKLNDKYGQARSQILIMNSPSTVNKCYAMIVQDVIQRALSGDHHGICEGVNPTAFLTNRPSGSGFGGSQFRGRRGKGKGHLQRKQRGPYCDYFRMKGHTRENCNKLEHCTYYNMQDHTKEICFQLIGYPFDWKEKKESQHGAGS